MFHLLDNANQEYGIKHQQDAPCRHHEHRSRIKSPPGPFLGIISSVRRILGIPGFIGLSKSLCPVEGPLNQYKSYNSLKAYVGGYELCSRFTHAQ